MNTITKDFTLPAPEFDQERREVSFTWTLLDKPWEGEGDSWTTVTLSIQHRNKMYRADISRAGVSQQRGYSVRHMIVARGEGLVIDREPVARYSKKGLQAFADNAAALFLDYLAGRGDPALADRVIEVANGRNYLTGE